MDADLLNSLTARRGHFLLESGYHTDFWFSLDALFVEPELVETHITRLAELLRAHDVSAICGPLLGGAFLAQALAGQMKLRFYYTQPVAAETANEAGLFSTRYSLPDGLIRRVGNERVAIVDDFISAGSSVRATAEALTKAGATVEVVGTLMLLGNEAVSYFSERSIPVVSCAQKKFDLWPPDNCPLCQTGVSLENLFSE